MNPHTCAHCPACVLQWRAPVSVAGKTAGAREEKGDDVFAAGLADPVSNVISAVLAPGASAAMCSADVLQRFGSSTLGSTPCASRERTRSTPPCAAATGSAGEGPSLLPFCRASVGGATMQACSGADQGGQVGVARVARRSPSPARRHTHPHTPAGRRRRGRRQRRAERWALSLPSASWPTWRPWRQAPGLLRASCAGSRVRA